MSPAAAAVAEATTFQMIPVTKIQPSPLNPRKHFDQAKLVELAATMGNGVGIIEPLVVRPFDIGRQIGRDAGKAARNECPPFEIIAGERRWRAAQIAGLVDVPAIVKELADAQVLEIMVIENDQREDINPLEEGDGFKRLMKFGFDIDKLAARIGRSRKYIYDRVKLLDLVDEGKQLLLNGRITAGHAIIVARLLPAQQQQVLKVSRDGFGRIDGPLFEREDTLFTEEQKAEQNALKKADRYEGLKAKTVRELQAWVDEHCHFDPTAPVNVELFPQTAATVAEARKVVPITHAHHVHPDAKDGDKWIYSVVSWKRADKRTCDYAVTGMVVAGAGRGEAFPVCVNKDKCKVHWPQDVKRREERAKKAAAAPGASKSDPKSAQKQAAAADRQKAKAEAERRARGLADARRETVETRATEEALEHVTSLTPDLVRCVLHRVLTSGDVRPHDFSARFGVNVGWNPQLKALEKLPDSILPKAIVFCLIQESFAWENDAAAALFKLLQVDVKRIDAEVAREQAALEARAQTSAPDPKSAAKKKAPKKR